MDVKKQLLIFFVSSLFLTQLQGSQPLTEMELEIIKNETTLEEYSNSLRSIFNLKVLNHYFDTGTLHSIDDWMVFSLLRNIDPIKQTEKTTICLKILNYYLDTNTLHLIDDWIMSFLLKNINSIEQIENSMFGMPKITGYLTPTIDTKKSLHSIDALRSLLSFTYSSKHHPERSCFCFKALTHYFKNDTLHSINDSVIHNLIDNIDDTRQDEKSTFCLDILNTYFKSDKLHSINATLIRYLLQHINGTKKTAKSIFCLTVLNTYFESDILHTINNYTLYFLLEHIDDTKQDEKSTFCLKILNHYFINDRLHLINNNIIFYLLKNIDQTKEIIRSTFCLDILTHYFTNGTLHLINDYTLYSLLHHISDAKKTEKSSFCLDVLNTYFKHDQFSFSFFDMLISNLSDAKEKTLFNNENIQKLRAAINCNDDTTPSDRYFKKHGDSILTPKTKHCFSRPMLSTLAHLKNYAYEEHSNDRIVFYHGQNSQWPVWQMIFKKLYHIKYHTILSDDFIFLRYTTTFIPDLTPQSIKDNGVDTKNTIINGREHILFANLAPFANEAGSNSLAYAMANSDQSVAKKRVSSDLIEKFFKELDMHEEYLFLQKTYPASLDDLKKSFDMANEEQGNHGFLIAISMPKETVRKLAYPTASGGRMVAITIDKKPTTDVVTIAENFDQVPFKNEYGIILSKTILDPQEAEKAGIKMRYFNPLVTPQPITKALHDFYEKLDEVIAIIQKHYEERTNK